MIFIHCSSDTLKTFVIGDLRTPPLDADRAVARLMRFLAIEGVTGQEKAIAAEVVTALRRPASRPRRFVLTTGA